MAEYYPDDATLLAATEDDATGVEYIATGKSPYHLEFRKLLQRLILSTVRANDLRVYQDGELTIGVRPGRAFVQGAALNFAGDSGVAVTASTTTHVWLDSAGDLQTGTGGLPTDRTSFVPLAEITVGSDAITSITDLRGEALLQIADLPSLGLTATAAEINQALDGISATVDAAALDTLTAGPGSTADSEHRHLQFAQNADSEQALTLINDSNGASANIALVLSLPNAMAHDLVLLQNRDNGFLSQRYDATTYNLLGVVHAQFNHEGDLTASLTDKLIGVVPVNGVVSDVVLSIGSNLDSDTGTDGVSATVKVNGTAVTSTDPSITDADGTGFRSTAQGDGASAAVKSDGTEDVTRGDVLTVDVTRTVTGTLSAEAANVVVLVVIRVNQPE